MSKRVGTCMVSDTSTYIWISKHLNRFLHMYVTCSKLAHPGRPNQPPALLFQPLSKKLGSGGDPDNWSLCTSNISDGQVGVRLGWLDVCVAWVQLRLT